MPLFVVLFVSISTTFGVVVSDLGMSSIISLLLGSDSMY